MFEDRMRSSDFVFAKVHGGESSTWYEILEVEPGVTETELKKAYRRLSLVYHPDKSGSSDSSDFQVLKRAYDVLSNAEFRLQYDQFLASKYHP